MQNIYDRRIRRVPPLGSLGPGVGAAEGLAVLAARERYRGPAIDKRGRG
jgi:hypothetical protein